MGKAAASTRRNDGHVTRGVSGIAALGVGAPSDDAGLRIYLFATVRIEYGGQAIGANLGGQTLELLAFLLTHCDRPLSRKLVAATLWPDDAEGDGLSRLRRYLFRLNAALPTPTLEPWIRADKASIQWNRRAGAWADVWQFGEACLSTETHDEAIRLYTGDLLSRYEGDWITTIRDGLRSDYEAVLLQSIESARQRSDLHAAQGYATLLLASDPWREDMVRALMDVHDRLGDRSGALNIFRDFAERLLRELQAEPMLETRSLHERISERPQRETKRQHNLPTNLTSFLGREGELSTLQSMAQSAKTRVITLVGAGGVGKSRLALEFGRSVRSSIPDGVWLVELARIAPDANVPKAVAEALSISEEPNRSLIDSICSVIGSQRLVIILDNCEHVLDSAAGAAAKIARECPSVVVLATSRVALRIDGETRFFVSPLPVPPRQQGGPPILSYPSVELFVSRASLHGAMPPDPDADALSALRDIAQRLDGLPLAIELAATRLSTLTLRELASGLDDMFNILVDGSRDALPQHRTMRALIDWSVQFLTKPELNLLLYLSLFSGGMLLQAGAEYFDGDGSAAIRSLSALVDQSLVTSSNNERVSRYRLLESVAAYCREQLLEEGKLGERRLQHAEWCLSYATRWMAQRGELPLDSWLTPLRDEIDNFRSALQFCLSGAAPELGAKLASVLNSTFKEIGPLESLRWIEAALAALPPSADPMRFAELYMAIGTYDGVVDTKITRVDAIKRALAMYDASGDEANAAKARQLLAISYISAECRSDEEIAYAFSIAQKNVDFFRTHGTGLELDNALTQFGIIAGHAGDDTARHDAFAESLTVRKLPDLEESRARISSFNAFIESDRNNVAAAREYWREALQVYRQSPEIRRIQHMRVLQGIAETSFQLGDAPSALEAQEWAFELALGQEIFYERRALFVAMYACAAREHYETAAILYGFVTANGERNSVRAFRDALMARLQARLPCERFAELYRDGTAMTIGAVKEAVDALNRSL
jgi:predicted ATPase/DNA-binding SARP family transcriptional activator